LAAAKRVTPFLGTAVPNYFHKPYGPGWALVGDAGYNKDFITAQGINDAFRDAGLLATALDQSFSGARSFDDAMGDYQHIRDTQVLPMYEMTCEIATLAPPPPEMQHVIGAIQGNQKAMDGFVQMNAGTISPADFMAPQNIAAMMSASKY
jgi:2-polyprenyl-6-methoxyphenol hydroxylase-like FAD-dependent oxidoreductase